MGNNSIEVQNDGSPIISFFDAERFIKETIESVLQQHFGDWELILVDDGSSDRSTPIALNYAKDFQNKIFYTNHKNHTNKGLSASRNAGFSLAKGRYITFLDADDIWLTGHLANMLHLIQCQKVPLVCESTEYWYNWNNPSKSNKLIHIGAEANQIHFPPALSLQLYPLGEGSSPCMHALIIEKETILKYRGFDESFTGMYEDIVFLSKIFLNEPVFISSTCNNLYRQRDDSMLSNAHNTGKYNFYRKKFLNWYKNYLTTQNISDEKIRQSLKKAFRPYSIRQTLINLIKRY